MKLFRVSTVPVSLNILLKGQLQYLNRHFKVTAISGAGQDLDEVARREGVAVHPIEMQRQISPLKDLVSLIRLYFFFKKEKPQIVHSITPKAGLLAMLAAKMAGVPVRMHTFTGLIFPTRTGLMQRLLIKMDQLLCWAATQVYPEGNGVKNDMIRFHITSKPLKILANGNVNGIDLTYFSADEVSDADKETLKNTWDIKETDFIFIFVGRLVGDKGINELISAFKQLNGSSAQQVSKLLLVGPLETSLDPLKQETLDEIGRNPNILSLAYQPDVRPYLAVSDALVFPSYREGFPNVVMQAGAMGLPAIVTDINGCNEIIEEGKNGTIIPPKDAGALQKAMERMMAVPAWRRSLKENARPMIAARYEQQIVWEALLAEYQTLVNRWSSSDRN